MEPSEFDLSMQLGITAEDAAFLQQVLSEASVNGIQEMPDLTADNTSIDVATVVQQANEDPILQKIPSEDNDSTSRFSSAIWYEKIQQQTIILAGLGGIGRFGNLVY